MQVWGDKGKFGCARPAQSFRRGGMEDGKQGYPTNIFQNVEYKHKR